MNSRLILCLVLIELIFVACNRKTAIDKAIGPEDRFSRNIFENLQHAQLEDTMMISAEALCRILHWDCSDTSNGLNIINAYFLGSIDSLFHLVYVDYKSNNVNLKKCTYSRFDISTPTEAIKTIRIYFKHKKEEYWFECECIVVGGNYKVFSPTFANNFKADGYLPHLKNYERLQKGMNK